MKTPRTKQQHQLSTIVAPEKKSRKKKKTIDKSDKTSLQDEERDEDTVEDNPPVATANDDDGSASNDDGSNDDDSDSEQDEPSTFTFIRPHIGLPHPDSSLPHPILESVRARELGQLERDLDLLSATELYTITDSEKRTVLHYAVYLGTVKLIRCILQHPLDAMKRELSSKSSKLRDREQDIHRWGSTQDLSLFQNWKEGEGRRQLKQTVLQQRVIHRQMIAAADSQGRNVFHYIAAGRLLNYDSAFESLSILSRLGDLASVRDTHGWPPIQYAAWKGNIRALQWLMKFHETHNRFTQTEIESILSYAKNPIIKTKLIDFFSRGQHHLSSCSSTITLLKHSIGKLEHRTGIRLQAPIHIAASKGEVQAIEFLQRQGVDLCITDGNGWTALHYAASSSSSIEAAKTLLSYNFIDVNQQTLKGQTALHLLCLSKNNEIEGCWIRLLANAGAALDIVDNVTGATPLVLAASTGKEKVIKTLLDANPDLLYALNKNGSNSLHVAAAGSHHHVVKVLVTFDIEKRRLLYKKNSQGQTPLTLVRDAKTRNAMCNNIWIAAFNGKFQPNTHGEVNAKTKPSRKGALHFCIDGLARNPTEKSKYKATALALINAGINIESQDRDGVSPVMLAAKYGLDEILLVFLEQQDDINVNLQDSNGNSALHYAYAYCHARAARILEALPDVDLEIQNDLKQTPMDVAGYKKLIY